LWRSTWNRIEWLPDEPTKMANDYVQDTLLFLDTTLGVAVDVLPLDAFDKVGVDRGLSQC
jgi:hypothetical protein